MMLSVIRCSLLALALTASVSAAQPRDAEPPEALQSAPDVPSLQAVDEREPQVVPAVRRLLDAMSLTDDERRDLRLRHGVWTEDDIADTAARARAALVSGAIDAAALRSEEADVLDRADAALRRGDVEDAAALVANERSARGVRILVESLEMLGRPGDAIAEAGRLARRMRAEPIRDADELAEAVRTLALRRRLAGPELAGARDDEALLDLLKTARERLDPLSWKVRLVEAELLYERHNLKEAGEAAMEAIRRNPKAAEAYAVLGRLAVDGFNLDGARAAADELESLAGEFNAINPRAAMLQARAMLRQDSPDAAIQSLAPARDALPKHRGLLALHAAASFAGFDEPAGQTLLDRFDALSPRHPLASYETGSALAEQRQYDLARDMLTRAAQRLPTWSQPWIELGLLEIQAGRDAEAEAALRTAIELDAFNRRASNSLELVESLRPWPIIESEHFRVRYRAGVDAVLASEMLPVLEDIHARVTADPSEVPGGIGHEPQRKTLIEIMPGHDWFSVRITGNTRVHTMAAATGPLIAMESPREGPGFSVGPFDWPRVIQHEYAHTVTLSRTRNRIPHWFTEAAAVHLEDAPRAHRTWELLLRAHQTGSLFDLEQINIAFVRPEKPTDRGQAYAQGHWMYQYIIDRWGDGAPLALMDRYAAGEAETIALERELGVTREAFMSDFTQWAEADLRAHGLLPPEGQPDVAVLVDGARLEAEAAGDAFEVDRTRIEGWLERFPDHPGLLDMLIDEMIAEIDGSDGLPKRLPGDLVEMLERTADARPTDDRPRRLLARHYLEAGAGERQANAIEHLEFLDAREQNSATYAVRLANLYAAREDLDRALTKALRAVRISPFDADHRELAARVAIVGGDLRQASHQIEALTTIEPDREIHRRRLQAIRDRFAGD